MLIIVRQQIHIVTPSSFWIGFLFPLILSGCSLEPAPLRKIRAHWSNKEGVAHAEPLARAQRYCQYCHGFSLQGGEHGEPSCFQCHGSRWPETDPTLSLAPLDHSSNHDGFFHHPDFAKPYEACVACHGADLKGQLDEGAPSCYLCHDQKWPD